MANDVYLNLKVNGPRIEEFRDHWDSVINETPAEPPEPTMPELVCRCLETSNAYPDVFYYTPYYASYGRRRMGCSIEGGILEIRACCDWRPPIMLIDAMSARWPDLEFVLESNIEFEMYETWHFQAGKQSLIEVLTAPPRTPIEWHVREGVFLNWPDWFACQGAKEVHFRPFPQWATEALTKSAEKFSRQSDYD